jgi:hypothetical protein
MKLICFFLGHLWTKWKYVRSVGRYDDRIDRRCKRCNELQTHIGRYDYDKNGDIEPEWRLKS